MKLKFKHLGSYKLYKSIPKDGFRWLREVQGDSFENHHALNELLDLGLVGIRMGTTDKGTKEFIIIRQ